MWLVWACKKRLFIEEKGRGISGNCWGRKKLSKGYASLVVSTTKGSRATVLMATPAEESKIGNSLLYFTSFTGIKRVT